MLWLCCRMRRLRAQLTQVWMSTLPTSTRTSMKRCGAAEPTPTNLKCTVSSVFLHAVSSKLSILQFRPVIFQRGCARYCHLAAPGQLPQSVFLHLCLIVILYL